MENTHIEAEPIQFTAAALEEFKRILASNEIEGATHLRIGVKGGGCSGMSYLLGFDKPEADDEIFEIKGIPVIMKPAHKMYLVNMQIDYSNGLDARGFVFNNPNASDSCGCGTSFAV